MTPAKLAKLLDKLHTAEADMLRAVRKWDKIRAQVRRAEKALDKDFARTADGGGKADWRDFGDEPQHIHTGAKR